MKLSATLHASLLALYTAGVAVLSLLPPKSFQIRPPPLPHMDKIVHGLLYAVLAALVCWTFRPTAREHRKLALIVAAVGAYGWLMELAQRWMSHGQRSYEGADALANLAGAGLMTLLWACLHRPAAPGAAATGSDLPA